MRLRPAAPPSPWRWSPHSSGASPAGWTVPPEAGWRVGEHHGRLSGTGGGVTDGHRLLHRASCCHQFRQVGRDGYRRAFVHRVGRYVHQCRYRGDGGSLAGAAVAAATAAWQVQLMVLSKDLPLLPMVHPVKSVVVCACTGAGGSRTAPAKRERTLKAQRLRRVNVGTGGNRPQQARSGSRASVEPRRLPPHRTGTVSGRTRRSPRGNSGRQSRNGFRPCPARTTTAWAENPPAGRIALGKSAE